MGNVAAVEREQHHCEKRLKREHHRMLEKCIAPIKTATEEEQFRADCSYISEKNLQDIEEVVNALRTDRELFCGVTNLKAQGRSFFRICSNIFGFNAFLPYIRQRPQSPFPVSRS